MPARDLTDRELDVLGGISNGLTYRSIGERLGLSEDSAKRAAHSLFTKLHARDRAHAVAIAFRAGLLQLHEEA